MTNDGEAKVAGEAMASEGGPSVGQSRAAREAGAAEVVKVKGKGFVLEVGPYRGHVEAGDVAVGEVVRRDYGHHLEDCVPGTVFTHPRGVTLDRGSMLAYARAFMEANPLYLNEAFAVRQGYKSLPAAPHMVLNLALSLGVQNDSEKAIANLGYWDVRFLRPVYAGDTLVGKTRVIDRKDRGADKPGIVTVETLAENQDGRVVVQYRRKIMVPRRGAEPMGDEVVASEVTFPWHETPKLHVPFVALSRLRSFSALRASLPNTRPVITSAAPAPAVA